MARGYLLNRRLVLEEAVEIPDGSGGFDKNWQPLGIIWANIKARAGVQSQISGGELALVRHRILLRAAPYGDPARPKANQRFRQGGRVYMIDAVTNHDDARLYLECWVHEETPI